MGLEALLIFIILQLFGIMLILATFRVSIKVVPPYDLNAVDEKSQEP